MEKHMKIITLIMVFYTSVWSATPQTTPAQPSFSCENVKKGSTEYHICSDTNLSTLDKKLNTLYHDFYLLTPELKQTQKEWLKKRDRCKKNTCIQKAYEERIDTLQQALQTQKQFPKAMLDIFKIRDIAKKSEFLAIDKNGTRDKNPPGCKAFYNDLFLFKGVKVVKPTLYKVDYNNTKLKEALGICWDMKMEYNVYPRSKPYLREKFSTWYSDVDGDGSKNFLFGQNYLESSRAEVYLLDQALCKKAIAKPKFSAYDQEYLSKSYMQGHENIVLEYKGKGYLFSASSYREDDTESRFTFTRRGVKDPMSVCYYWTKIK